MKRKIYLSLYSIHRNLAEDCGQGEEDGGRCRSYYSFRVAGAAVATTRSEHEMPLLSSSLDVEREREEEGNTEHSRSHDAVCGNTHTHKNSGPE